MTQPEHEPRLVEPDDVYLYVDEQGAPLFEVVRRPGKRFAQRRPDGDWGIDGVRRVIYRLPRVLEHLAANDEHAALFVVEGEKDVHAIEAAGGVATSNPGGAGKWRDEYSESLAGARRVVVVADRDEPGRRHAADVIESLARVGVAAELVEAREGKDSADHLEAGFTLADFEPVTAAAEAAFVDPTVTLAEFVTRTGDESAAPLIRCEQGDVLPAHALGLLVAKTGAGKTTHVVDLLLHAAAGLEHCGLSFPRPLRILMIENEGPREAFREKLERRWQHWIPHEGEVAIRVWDDPAMWGQVRLSNAEQLEQLRTIVAQHRIDLCVSDTLTRFGMRGNGTPEETRDFVELLTRAGLGRETAFLLLHHPITRPDQVADELERIAGAWPPHADAILVLHRLQNMRARLSYPKLRYTRGPRPASILSFDPDRETFALVSEETDAAITTAKEADALDWIVAYVDDHFRETGGAGIASGKVETAYHEAHGKHGRNLARRVIEREIASAARCLAGDRTGETSPALATTTGATRHGKYLIPFSHALSPLAATPNGETGETGAAPSGTSPLATLAVGVRGDGEWRDGGEGHGDSPKPNDGIEWR